MMLVGVLSVLMETNTWLKESHIHLGTKPSLQNSGIVWSIDELSYDNESKS